MADPRDTARAWLAETIARARNPWADRDEVVVMPKEYADCLALADAILGASADVEEDRIRRFPQEVGDDEPMEVRNPRHMRITHTQAVIRLPAQPVEDQM